MFREDVSAIEAELSRPINVAGLIQFKFKIGGNCREVDGRAAPDSTRRIRKITIEPVAEAGVVELRNRICAASHQPGVGLDSILNLITIGLGCPRCGPTCAAVGTIELGAGGIVEEVFRDDSGMAVQQRCASKNCEEKELFHGFVLFVFGRELYLTCLIFYFLQQPFKSLISVSCTECVS